MALVNALKFGNLKGAAIDVFQVDSFHPLNGPLKDAPNLIVSPHTSFYSDLSSKEMREMAAQEVRRGLLNKSPLSLRNCVNKELLLNSNANSTGNNPNGNNSLNSNNVNNNNGLSNSNNSSSNSNASSNNIRSGSSPANLLGASMGNPLTAASILSASSNLNSSNSNAQLLAQLSCKNSFICFATSQTPRLLNHLVEGSI